MSIQTQLILLWLGAVNLLAFALMGLDKWKARNDRWRIPEKTLFLFPVLGGTVGGIAGMRCFHHKTKHWYFRWGLPVLLLVQLGAAAWIGYRLFS